MLLCPFSNFRRVSYRDKVQLRNVVWAFLSFLNHDNTQTEPAQSCNTQEFFEVSSRLNNQGLIQGWTSSRLSSK